MHYFSGKGCSEFLESMHYCIGILTDEIYIVTGRTDMRKSIDGLCAIVEDQLHMDPRRSALYLFCGKRCDRIKALLWESDGFVLLLE